MKSIKNLTLACAFAVALPASAMALDASYPAELASQFTGWCSGEGYTAQVCSCALTKSAAEIPASAMASYMAAAEGQATATMSAGVGATVVQIITTCSATSSGGGTSSGTGDAMKSLGGLLGK